MPPTPSHPPKNSRRRSLLSQANAALGTLFWVSVSWAGDLSYKATLTTDKSPAHVWSVMSAYPETCEKGCKYARPGLVKVKKLAERQTSTKYYTWSHMKHPLRDVKYFSEVTLTRKSDGHFTTQNRQLEEGDRALVEELEKKTGLPHSPVFDRGITKTTTEAVSGKTKVTQTLTMVTSGVMSVWDGKVRRSMEDSVAVTFANIQQ